MEDAIKKLKELKAKRILIQFPEGLRYKIQDVAKKLEENGFEYVLCMEPLFGACDVRDFEGKQLDCDAILHIGHEKIIKKSKIPVVYWEYFFDADVYPILEKESDKLGNFNSIGLITSLQFVKIIPLVKNFLKKIGKKVFVHKSLQYPGQILGCNFGAAKAIEDKVDCFLCISAGKFYSLGLTLHTNKPVLNLDLERKEICSMEDSKKKILKIKAWNKAQFEEVKKIGILVSWKKGQMFENPFEVKKKLEEMGKEVYILAMDEITSQKLEGLKLDLLVSVGCPRIGIDDLEKFKTPILNTEDLYSLNK